MEMTIEQKRAMALANARRRAEEEAGGPRDSFLGKVDSAVRGAADVLSFGLADEAAAGADALFNPVFGTGQAGETIADRYNKNLAAQRAIDRSDAEERGGYRLAGQIAGGVTGGAGLAKSGLSLGSRAAEAGGGLGRVAAGSLADGALLGAAQGFGSGEGGAIERGKSAMIGGALGGATGVAAPLAIAGVGAAIKPIVSPIMSRVAPDRFAGRALSEAARRAGLSADDVGTQLEAARAAGQDVFTVADALGNSGQRMLSTAARNPHDERQALAEFLQARQAGQGRRVASALSEGFGAPDTAVQRVSALTGARDTAANVAYDAARKSAGVVDVSPAIAKIDEVLSPGATGVLSPRSNISDDSVEGVLSRVRGMLTDGTSNLSDFNAVLRAKQDVDDMIGRAVRSGAGNQARLLTQIKQNIDDALAAASKPYAAARDAFRQGSQEIEAVDVGRNAALRGRPDDTIPAFQRMAPGQQAAFRAGYADPLIEQAQSAATGVNKARPLISDATAAEFPAFAVPGEANRLGERLAREARMFETNQAALGGSRTADNLADATDMAQFDPSIVSNLARGNIVAALMSAASGAVQGSKGLSPPVLSRLTRALMETDPEAARKALVAAADQSTSDTQRRALIGAILSNTGAAGTGRLAAP